MAYDSGQYSMTIKDSSKEKSGFSVNIAIPVEENITDLIATRDALINAIEGVINGVIQDDYMTRHKRFNTTPPAGQGSRRETKLMVVFEDTTTLGVYNFTIPTFDISKVTMIAGTDRVDMTVGAAATLKTAILNFVKSPVAGHGINVTEMISVGRNL